MASEIELNPNVEATPIDSARAHKVTLRSVLVGCFFVCVICGLTPYNDYILENTPMIGSYLPVAVVLAVTLLVLVGNAPLYRWAPRWVLTPVELAVILGMMLASCSIPGQGWMRTFLPSLVVPFYYGSIDAQFWKAFVGLDLPRWLWPVDYETGRTDPLVVEFYNRSPEGIGPYSRWIAPLAVWSIFAAGLWCTLIGLAAIVRYQWAQNERLAFPLARVQAMLIEPPERGRVLNRLFSRRAFWIGLVGVFAIQSLAALHVYFPTTFPEMSLKYNLTRVMSNPPWMYFASAVKTATIYFTFVGVAYFIQSRIAFSLFAFYLIQQLVNVNSQMMFQQEINAGVWGDQHLGAAVAFLIGTLWIGRKHWVRVVRQMFGARSAKGEPTGWYISYRIAGWMVVGGLVVMTGWLIVVGVRPWFAMVIVGFLVMFHFVVARIVAVTGMPLIRVNAGIPQLYVENTPQFLSGRDVFWAGVWTVSGAYPTRESLMPFAMQGMQINEEVMTESEASAPGTRTDSESARVRHRFMAAIGLALVLGFAVATASCLFCYYYYAMPLTAGTATVENPGGLETLPKLDVVDRMDRYAEGRFPPRPYHDWAYKFVGAGVMGALQYLSLRYANWPLAPVGYLTIATWQMQMAWFSIFLGWLAKIVTLRFGGIRMYEQARPLFIGLIFGESLAAAVWMMVALVLASSGHAYQRIQMLPF